MRKFNLTNAILSQWFDEFNKDYFNSSLPKWRFEIKPNCCSYFGKCCYMDKLIRMSTYIDRDEWHFRQTLLHEMIHEYQFINNLELGHGKSFKEKAEEINRIGGWKIQRCSEDNSKPVKPKKRITRTENPYVNVLVWVNKENRKCFSLMAQSSVDRLIKFAREHKDSYKNITLYGASREKLSSFRKSNRLAYYYYSNYGYALEDAIIKQISIGA